MKGRGIAVLNRSEYKNEIDRQLNSKYYDLLDDDMTKDTKRLVVAQLEACGMQRKSMELLSSISTPTVTKFEHQSSMSYLRHRRQTQNSSADQ